MARAVVVPDTAVQWRFSRSSGPGGQGVNTTDSRVSASLDLRATPLLDDTQRRRALDRLRDRLVDGVLTVTASEHRSQLRNREAALARLSALLTGATQPPPPPRRATRPSAASQERRLLAKRRRAANKSGRRARDD